MSPAGSADQNTPYRQAHQHCCLKPEDKKELAQELDGGARLFMANQTPKAEGSSSHSLWPLQLLACHNLKGPGAGTLVGELDS